MNAFRLPDGRVLVPRRAEGPGGLVGDGLVVVDADSDEARSYARWTVPAPQELLEAAGRVVDGRVLSPAEWDTYWERMFGDPPNMDGSPWPPPGRPSSQKGRP